MKYIEEVITKSRTYYHVIEKNKKGENITVEIIECDRNNHDKNKYPEKWLFVNTYVTDTEGGCRGAYNPTYESYEYGMKIKDDLILPATEKNKKKLLNMTIDLFMAATGKTATEVKIARINEYAKKNRLDVNTLMKCAK